MPAKMKTYDELSQLVWSAPSEQMKRDLLTEMVEQFTFKGKHKKNVAKFLASIKACKNGKELDRMAANLALNATDSVVQVYA